jgi:hypothetical protein
MCMLLNHSAVVSRYYCNYLTLTLKLHFSCRSTTTIAFPRYAQNDRSTALSRIHLVGLFTICTSGSPKAN